MRRARAPPRGRGRHGGPRAACAHARRVRRPAAGRRPPRRSRRGNRRSRPIVVAEPRHARAGSRRRWRATARDRLRSTWPSRRRRSATSGRGSRRSASVRGTGSGPFGAEVLASTRPPLGPLPAPGPGRAHGRSAGAPGVGYHRAMTETDAAPTFRDAEPADADWIAGLLSDEGYPAGASDIVRRLERFAEMGSLVRVAERDGERLGFIAVHLVPRFEHDDQLARVIAMVVDPAVRSRGVGRALLAEVDRVAAEARLRVRRGDGRPPSRRRAPALRGGRLRRLGDHLPAEASAERAFVPPAPAAGADRGAPRASVGGAARGLAGRTASSCASSRSARRGTWSASSSATAPSTPSRRSRWRSPGASTRRSCTWSTSGCRPSARSGSPSGPTEGTGDPRDRVPAATRCSTGGS